MLLIFAVHKNKIGYLLEKGEGCIIASVFPKTETGHLVLQTFGFVTLFHTASFVAKSSKYSAVSHKALLFPLIFSDCVLDQGTLSSRHYSSL